MAFASQFVVRLVELVCGLHATFFASAYTFFLEQGLMQWDSSTVSLSQPLCQYFCCKHERELTLIVYVYFLGAPFSGCKCNKCSLPAFLPLSSACRRFYFRYSTLLLSHHSWKQNLVASSCNLLEPQLCFPWLGLLRWHLSSVILCRSFLGRRLPEKRDEWLSLFSEPLDMGEMQNDGGNCYF